ncbi:MAG: glycosyltransferase family 4 protein [Dysgonamonadaceae bacterium]|jgi:glycosyltransferase involved in cell wall biosynthesis|nr:glycosyltransferase family 4 protein [Dysgonamonadaceae bacterium]
MKILQIANGDFFSTYGGGQVYVKNLVDEMIRQGLDVSVLSFVNKKSDIPFQKQNYKGVDLYEVYQKDESIIKTLIQKIAPDIIHIHAEKALISRISRELSIRNVVTAHHGGIVCPAGTLLNCKDEICKVPVNQKDCTRCVLRNTKTGECFYPLLKIMPLSLRLKMGKALAKLPFIYFVTPIVSANLHIENKQKEWETIIRNTDRMIAPSYAIADSMVLNRFPKDKIKIVPHGIPVRHCELRGTKQEANQKIDCFEQSSRNDERNLSSFHNKLKFFYVGRIGHIKGIHLLLKAFSQLDTSLCELHLVGDIKGKCEQKWVKQYKHCSNIFFHGKIQPDEVAKCIQQWDVLVHPAIYLEVFGLNISEALSEGKPVIATRCGGAEMQIQDKINGLLIEPNNIDELKNAMQWMIDHPAERKKMAKLAPEKVISMEEHVKDLLDVYEKTSLH